MADRFNRAKIMRSVLTMCRGAGIGRDDRMELASAILDLGSGLTSYNQLTDEDLGILYWALIHWRLIQRVRLANGTLSNEAHTLVEMEAEEDAAIREQFAGIPLKMDRDDELISGERPASDPVSDGV